MNAEDKLRFSKSISRAIEILEKDAFCFCYKDTPEYQGLIEDMKCWLSDAANALSVRDLCWNLKYGDKIYIVQKGSEGRWETVDGVHAFMDVEDLVLQSGEILHMEEYGTTWLAYRDDPEIEFDDSDDDDDDELLALAEARLRRFCADSMTDDQLSAALQSGYQDMLDGNVHDVRDVFPRPYQVGPGWWLLLDDAAQRLREIDPDVQIEAKGKYGLVCIDVNTKHKDLFAQLNDIANQTEDESGHICEACGLHGKTRELDGWLITLCDRCAALDSIERRKIEEKTRKSYQEIVAGLKPLRKVEQALKNAYVKVHAVYDPDGSEIFGDCYCAAVDLFHPGMAFRIYYKIDDRGEMHVEHAERWFFG